MIARTVRTGVTLGVHEGVETGLGPTKGPQVAGEALFPDLGADYKVVCLIILIQWYLCFV